MSNYDPYEADREDNGVREQCAEDHGYSSYRCPTCHKTFWSDSEAHCETCEDPDGRYYLGEIGDDGPTPEHYGDSVEDVAQAAKQYNLSVNKFNTDFLWFMDAMKRNGVL